MRKGSSIIPAVAILFAVGAFLLVMSLAMSKPEVSDSVQVHDSVNGTTNSAANSNTVVTNENTNTSLNINSVVNQNTNIATDPTAGWKTYTNSQFSFQVKYPPTWNVVAETTNRTADDGVAFRVKPTTGTEEVIIYPSGTKGLSLPPTIQRTATAIGGRSAEKIVYTPSTGAQGCYYRLLAGSVTWAIGGANSNAYENFQLGCTETSTESQILSTFTFTQP